MHPKKMKPLENLHKIHKFHLTCHVGLLNTKQKEYIKNLNGKSNNLSFKKLFKKLKQIPYTEKISKILSPEMENITFLLLFGCLIVCLLFFLPVTSNVIECVQYRMHSAIFIVEWFSDAKAKFDRSFICFASAVNVKE